MMNDLFDLTGKRALITKGVCGLVIARTQGLGHAVAELVVDNYSSDKLIRVYWRLLESLQMKINFMINRENEQ